MALSPTEVPPRLHYLGHPGGAHLFRGKKLRDLQKETLEAWSLSEGYSENCPKHPRAEASTHPPRAAILVQGLGCKLLGHALSMPCAVVRTVHKAARGLMHLFVLTQGLYGQEVTSQF